MAKNSLSCRSQSGCCVRDTGTLTGRSARSQGGARTEYAIVGAGVGRGWCMQRVEFAGPAGTLEGVLAASGFTSHGAVLCHPHPLYGGSMDDAVLGSVEDGLAAHALTCLRFNFRGVGASEGTHDEGYGEVEDILAAVEYLRSEGIDEILLGGYSFGAAMALKAAAIELPQALVLVAPPLSLATDVAFEAITCPVQVVLGEHDTLVDAAAVSEVLPHARVHIVAGADHYFYGAGEEIAEVVDDFIET